MVDNTPEQMFISGKPSERVSSFLKENPEFTWEKSLEFVLDNWPQVKDGSTEYLIEGGVALKLLYPERQEPNDIDVLSRSEEMPQEFSGVRRIDVKSLSHWYASRLHPYNLNRFKNGAGEFLLEMNQSVNFDGRNVLVLSPLGLSVSKTLPYVSGPLRPKDSEDLLLLDQDPEEIQQVINRINTIYPPTK